MWSLSALQNLSPMKMLGKGVSVFGREITYLAQKHISAKPILPADNSIPWVISAISINN